MKLKYLILAYIAVAFTSCEWGAPSGKESAIFKDTLSYKYKAIQRKAPDCKSATGNGCVIAKFKYPVFNAQPVLNDSVALKLAAMFSITAKTDTGLSTTAKQVFAEYVGQSSNNPQQAPFCPLNEYAKIVRQDSALTTIEIGGYIIRPTGQLSNISFLNWNPRTSKPVTLDDLFKPSYQDSLRAIAEGIFRKDERLSDSASFAKDYLFKGGNFALNNNYLITPMGLRFVYNEGEIKPRNAGFTILFIPYEKIKSLLKPHTAVTQFVR